MNAIDPRGEAAGPRASLRAFWAPPALTDPDELRQVRLLFGVVRPLIVSFVLLAAALAIPGVAPGVEGLRSAGLLLACVLPFVLAMALAHKRHVKLAGTLVVTTGLLSTASSVFLFGGLSGPIGAALLLVILEAGVLRGFKAALAVSLFAVVFCALELWMELGGEAPMMLAQVRPWGAFLTLLTCIALAVGLLGLYTHELLRAANAVDESATQVRSSERRLNELLKKSPDGLILIGLDGRVESVNDAVAEMTGYPASEMVGKKVVDLATIPEKSKPLSARNFELTLQGRGEIMRLELVRADGSPLIVETHPQLVTLPGGRQVIQSVLRDLTVRLAAEERERKLQLELLDARRMEGLGRLAGGIAHDFRNLLTPVLSNARMLREHSLTQEGRELVQEIEVASQRASNLVAQLLAFARRQMLEVRVLDLNDAVRDLEPMLRRLIREDISLKVSFAPVLQAVRADRGQLGQVLVNLVANARDAMPKGGALTIETLDAHLDDEYAAQHPGVKPGRYSTLVVTDTGEGMSEQVRQHVFEPFFTTKGAQEGTGLGLATVHGIVKQSGGSIHVYSEPGHGTTFRIYLPAVDELPEPKQEVKRTLPRAARPATVLVVDDEDLVRGVVLRILRGAGYSVLEASDGGEAVEVSKARNEPIDLLITDVVMPVLAGRELATAIEGHHRAVRVLYVSGYTEHGVVHGGELDPEIDFLVKPFTPEALLNKVDEILRRT